MALSPEDQKKVQEVITKFQTDPNFKKELISDPKKALEPFHLSCFEGKEIKVLEDTKTDFHIVVPHGAVADKFKVDKLPPNPKVGQVAIWVVCQIKGNTELKDRLLSNPEEVLKEKKINLPEGLKIHIHQNTETLRHFVAPRQIAEGEELTEDELEHVAGGKGKSGKGGGGGGGSSGTNVDITGDNLNSGTNNGYIETI